MLWAPPGFSHPSSLFNHPTARPLREAWGRGSRSPGLRDQPVPPSVIDGDRRPGREGLTQDHPKRGRRSWDLGQLPDSKRKLPTSYPHPPPTFTLPPPQFIQKNQLTVQASLQSLLFLLSPLPPFPFNSVSTHPQIPHSPHRHNNPLHGPSPTGCPVGGFQWFPKAQTLKPS